MKKLNSLACAAVGAVIVMPVSAASISDLRVDHRVDPLGIDSSAPLLTWRLELTPGETTPQELTVLVGDSRELTSANALHSATVDADVGRLVLDDVELDPATMYFWKVEGVDVTSDSAHFATGLLSEDDWGDSRWIGTDLELVPPDSWDPPDQEMPDPWFRKSFNLGKEVKEALVFTASVGYHEVYINGGKISEDVLAPAVSDLNQRARYTTYDVTSQLQQGDNVLGLWLGVAWSIFPEYDTLDKPLARSVLLIRYEDGTSERIVTDDSWKTAPSHRKITGKWFFSWYGGEEVDMRAAVPDWNTVSFSDASWDAASTFDVDLTLSAEGVEPNRMVAEVEVAEITTGSTQIVTFAKAFSGYIEVEVEGDPGDTVLFQISERRQNEEDNDMSSRIIIGPSGVATFRNRFNYHAGEFMRVSGHSNTLTADDVRGYVIRSDFDPAVTFEIADDNLQEIYDTTAYTFENLSLGGYVVDCPHRERMGYGGDAHSTSRFGLLAFRTGAFYHKWLQDWRDSQRANGDIPHTAPTYWGGGGPSWGGLAVMLPWEAYQITGDERFVLENIDMIREWIAFLLSNVEDDVLQKYGGENWDFLGDWVPPGGVPSSGNTQEALFFNNCYTIYNLDTAAELMDLAGETSTAQSYRSQADAMRTAVHERFYKEDEASYVNGRQAYLAMALIAEVPPTDVRDDVWATFEEEILSEQQGHIDTGITGTWALFKILTDADRPDLAMTILRSTGYPGYQHMLDEGATVWWEKWDGGGSRMHSSFIAVGQWMIEALGGVQPLEPGYASARIAPYIDGSVKENTFAIDTVRGEFACTWYLEGNDIVAQVEVPVGAKGKLEFPAESGTPSLVRDDGEAGSGLEMDVTDATARAEVDAGRYFVRSTAPSVTNPFRDAPMVGEDGWQEGFLGRVYAQDYPWVFTETFGWAYVSPYHDHQAAWIYDSSERLGWIYVTADYPWLYSYREGGWVYQLDAENGRYIWSSVTSEWKDIGVLPL